MDNPKDNKMSFDADIQAETFDPSTFIKQKDDLQDSIQIMREHFDLIKIYQLELIVGSDKYP